MRNTQIDEATSVPTAGGAPGGWVVRLAREGDVGALLDLAGQTGGGLTNLPNDRGAMEGRVAWSLASCARSIAAPDNELYLMVLEDQASGRIAGTSCIFSRIGVDWPFYTYKVSAITQDSRTLGRTSTERILSLTHDFDGASEVGGLFVDPSLRAGGLGKLLARSRYLFIAQHPERFAEHVIAELRGWTDGHGVSPFWEAVGRVFFDMPFHDADRFGAVHGNQFIAELMPKLPIYVSLLPPAAQAVIGRVHDRSAAALKMLQSEGFRFEAHVDVFDAGPAVRCRTRQIRTVREAKLARVAARRADPGGRTSLVCGGALQSFCAWIDEVRPQDGEAALGGPVRPPEVAAGDLVRHVPF